VSKVLELGNLWPGNSGINENDMQFELRITQITTNRHCRMLEKAGVIRSSPDPQYTKRNLWTLTAAGRTVADKLIAIIDKG
jgi:DNA-binding MarR family transcriptional regulator